MSPRDVPLPGMLGTAGSRLCTYMAPMKMFRMASSSVKVGLQAIHRCMAHVSGNMDIQVRSCELRDMYCK